MTIRLAMVANTVTGLWAQITIIRGAADAECVIRCQVPPGFGLTRGRAALRHQSGHLEVAGLNGTATFLFLYIFLYKIRYSEVR